MMIWITGVVGRSMGSGKFSQQDIPGLTKAAYNAWAEILDPLVASAPPPPQPPATPRPASAPTRHSQPYRSAPPGDINPNVQPETKPYHIWEKDKAYFGSPKWERVYGSLVPDITWGEWVRNAQQGDEKAIRALRKMASSEVGNDQWADRNRTKISRAIACLNLVTGGGDENTPF